MSLFLAFARITNVSAIFDVLHSVAFVSHTRSTDVRKRRSVEIAGSPIIQVSRFQSARSAERFERLLLASYTAYTWPTQFGFNWVTARDAKNDRRITHAVENALTSTNDDRRRKTAASTWLMMGKHDIWTARCKLIHIYILCTRKYINLIPV